MPRLALESPISSPVAESPRAETSLQVSPAAERPETTSQVWLGWSFLFCPIQYVSVFLFNQVVALQEQEGVSRTCRTRNREGSSEEKSSHSHGPSALSSAKAASMKTQNPSSSRLGGLWMPVLGTLLRASALS